MSNFKLDRTSFMPQTMAEAANHSDYYKKLTWQERLSIIFPSSLKSSFSIQMVVFLKVVFILNKLIVATNVKFSVYTKDFKLLCLQVNL